MGDFNINLRLKYEQQCPDCGLSDFVEDHASGDLVCRVSTSKLPARAKLAEGGGKIANAICLPCCLLDAK